MSDSAMIYSIHTIYNGGEPDSAEHYISREARLEGLRLRLVELEVMPQDEADALEEEELRAALEDAFSPTQGRVSLTEAEMSEVPPEPATIKQLFVLDTQDYDSFTGLYRDTQVLLAGLVEKIFAEGETFFSAEIKAEIQSIINRSQTGVAPVDEIHAAVLNEVSEVLEDSTYAVYVHNVALPA